MTYSDIESNIASGFYKNDTPYPKGRNYPDGHIFDENQTVKWNREQVELLRKEHKAAMDEYRRVDAAKANVFRTDLLAAIFNDIHVSEPIAIKIYNKAWEEGHSSGYSEVVYHASELATFVEEILELHKEV